MDVTRKNFYKILPNLKKALSEAEFITIDFEYTGLASEAQNAVLPFDTPRQYYEKIHHNSLDFLPLQLGLCIYQYDDSENKYTYQAYNFYTFKFSNLKGFPNGSFLCQSSSLAFLSGCGFDFNKAIAEGIPFLTQPEEDKLKLSIEERQQKVGRENSKDSSDVPVPDDLKNLYQTNMEKIREFLEDSSENKAESFILDRCNGFMRKLLYQDVPKEFGDTVHLETCDDSDFAMKIWRGGGEDFKRLREEEKKRKEWEEFEEAVGLSHLIKAISESGKLIVAHNCLLDVCHLVNRFRYPLPPRYDNFKEIVHHIFPRIIDTKFMQLAQQFKDLISRGSLGSLLETVSKAPFDMPTIEGNVEGHSYSNLIDKSHEGGYDAFITGQCFLAMCQYLAKDKGIQFSNIGSITGILSQFENRIYLMRLQDTPYLTLGAPDMKPPRNHVFHLRFPREWRQYDIVELFKRHGFGPVFVSFIDDRSAFVALHNRDQAKLVLNTMTGNKDYKVTSFGAYQKQNERKSPPLAQPASPSLNIPKKRKLGDTSDDASGSPDVFKKHRNIDQPKRSIDPIPEETEVDNIDNSELATGENQNTTSKEFPESEVWG